MKNMIAYKGKVTLKIMHGDKVVKTIVNHNAGTKLLMEFLARCLGAGADLVNNSPKYLRLYYNDTPGEMPSPENLDSSQVTLRPIVTNFSPSYPDYDGVKAGVVLTFLIPSSVINPNKSEVNLIALYDSSNKNDGQLANYMAWIEITKEEGGEIVPSSITISSGESLMILWEMTLENVVEA